MHRWTRLLPSLWISIPIAACVPSDDPAADGLTIPFERFFLENDLTVIVHENHEEPLVHVRLFYHVAERHMGPGQAGYAHLFEHLALSRSEDLDQTILSFIRGIGGSDEDAQSQYDFTHYFATAPVQALDTLLWVEAQRMGHLVGALTEDDLTRARTEVFEEEERLLREPSFRLLKTTWDHTYPSGHPYAGIDIAPDGLDRATLADALEFYERYYHPANAVLVVAGDVDPETVRARVEEQFGRLVPGSSREGSAPLPGRPDRRQNLRFEGVLPEPHFRLVWNTAGWGTAAAGHLALAAVILESRVQQRLAADQIAADVVVTTIARELGGQLILDVSNPPPASFSDIQRSIQREVERLGSEGSDPFELREAKLRYRSAFDREVASLSGTAHVLGMAELLWGDPAHLDVMLEMVAGATEGDVQLVVVEWLLGGRYGLEFTPAADL